MIRKKLFSNPFFRAKKNYNEEKAWCNSINSDKVKPDSWSLQVSLYTSSLAWFILLFILSFSGFLLIFIVTMFRLSSHFRVMKVLRIVLLIRKSSRPKLWKVSDVNYFSIAIIDNNLFLFFKNWAMEDVGHCELIQHTFHRKIVLVDTKRHLLHSYHIDQKSQKRKKIN